MSIERSKETHVPVGGPSNNREGSYRKIKHVDYQLSICDPWDLAPREHSSHLLFRDFMFMGNTQTVYYKLFDKWL